MAEKIVTINVKQGKPEIQWERPTVTIQPTIVVTVTMED